MKKQPDAKPEAAATPSTAGSEIARILAVLGVNLVLVLIVVIITSTEGGGLPDLNAHTLALGLLPVSAAAGLVLACRRLDLALPTLLALAIALRVRPPELFQGDPPVRLAILCGVCGSVCLMSALVTWFGRIASALWTGLLAIGLALLAKEFSPAIISSLDTWRTGGWPWPAALGASLGLLVAGAAALGAMGLVSLPSLPPIIRSGSKGLAGLASAWVIAGVAVALTSNVDATAYQMHNDYNLEFSYATMLAAGAMGGAYILRGRWGALTAVVLTSLSHLVWSFAQFANLGSPLMNVIVPAAAPLLAIPLYLFMDWLIRSQTSESAPTALLA
jgi:hypothetical protein